MDASRQTKEPGAGRQPGLDFELSFQAYSDLSLLRLQLESLTEGVAAMCGKLATDLVAAWPQDDAKSDIKTPAGANVENPSHGQTGLQEPR